MPGQQPGGGQGHFPAALGKQPDTAALFLNHHGQVDLVVLEVFDDGTWSWRDLGFDQNIVLCLVYSGVSLPCADMTAVSLMWAMLTIQTEDI
ncbi:hypothetical protein JCM31598_07550 [Desulfonatronum parangueonense]